MDRIAVIIVLEILNNISKTIITKFEYFSLLKNNYYFTILKLH